jgi:hypothetical protein
VVQKNIGKGMLASVQMRYFEEYQIFLKTFEGFLNFSPVFSEISRDFREMIFINQHVFPIKMVLSLKITIKIQIMIQP